MTDGTSSDTSAFPYGFSVTSPVYLSNITNKSGVSIDFSYSNPIYLTSSILYASLYERHGNNLSRSEKYESYIMI